MATRTVITPICDMCESDDMVETHVMSIDGKAVEAEACLPCWQKTMECLAVFSFAGRPVKPVKVKKADIVPFPGESWKFTSHALVRMGERHVNPTQAAKAADLPEMVYPGRDGETEIHIRGIVKVVCQPQKRLILTVAHRDEEVQGVAS